MFPGMDYFFANIWMLPGLEEERRRYLMTRSTQGFNPMNGIYSWQSWVKTERRESNFLRQMREFQSATGPSSALNSARGSTHGSLGSNLHQVHFLHQMYHCNSSVRCTSILYCIEWHEQFFRQKFRVQIKESDLNQFKAAEIVRWSRSLSKIRLKYVRPRLN